MSLNDQSVEINENDQKGDNQSMLISEGDIQNISFSTDNKESVFDDILEDTLKEFESKSEKKTIPYYSKILLIILYSDTTNVDTLEKRNLHLIYVLIDNIKNWRYNKPDIKQLLGYLLILKVSDNTEKQSENFKNVTCEVFHKSLEVLLNPLLNNNSIDLTLNSEMIWFSPRVSIIIAD
ncbi:3299_t:CDS:2 [Funneliformis caledonium]|uniref:3299_t:CDS:1 n=1 Tax=Funneliformis caledonium TaxID=1117310 RepID=A0A9N9B8Y7_9GLOM|nr:3299_t:CDS:2 [Funneliformis caledonium]